MAKVQRYVPQSSAQIPAKNAGLGSREQCGPRAGTHSTSLFHVSTGRIVRASTHGQLVAFCVVVVVVVVVVVAAGVVLRN
jgi:hypothetical protein